jgi:AraC-like DNA-binding protein
VTEAAAGAFGAHETPWEEMAVRLATRVVRLTARIPPGPRALLPGAAARVTRTIRSIEQQPGAGLTLNQLARLAGLSPYHFLRIFQGLTGITPHQYVMRSRLREAALRLRAAPDRVLDVALDSGFGDVSNFNRAFRTEFGVTPTRFRAVRT